MPVSLADIESRFATRNNGATLTPELRGLAARLGAQLDSVASICQEIEAAAEADRRYEKVVDAAGPVTNDERSLARAELGKGKPIAVVIEIIKAARRKKAANPAIPAGARSPGPQGPSRRP